MSVKITLLYDNHSDNCHFRDGWGFSALIEFEKCKILFDTGGDARIFSSNADNIQLIYNEITHLLFSHRHGDHIAGFKEVERRLGKEAELYVPKTFPGLRLKSSSFFLKKTKVVRGFETIAPNVYSLVLRGGFRLYEQALVLKTPQGLGIVTGCAHPGIIRVLTEVQKHIPADILFVLGGFHLYKSSEEYSANIVKQFQALRVQKVAPCHCSGDILLTRHINR